MPSTPAVADAALSSVRRMKFVALVSGGKDSVYCIMQCLAHGHELVALANLTPADLQSDECDSHMFQTIGHTAIAALADCLGVPLYRQPIRGTAIQTDLQYSTPTPAPAPAPAATPTAPSAQAPAASAAVSAAAAAAAVVDAKSATKATAALGDVVGDEVEDLFALIQRVQSAHPDVQAVSSGAILSNYQRTRVEHVCARLGLVSLAYLWQREQRELLAEMIARDVHAVLVKVASMGLLPAAHLGKSLRELQPHLLRLGDANGMNVCGEGGEYETFTLDCPIFKRKIVVDESELIGDLTSTISPVAVYRITKLHTEPKPQLPQAAAESAAAPAVSAAASHAPDASPTPRADGAAAAGAFSAALLRLAADAKAPAASASGSVCVATRACADGTGWFVSARPTGSAGDAAPPAFEAQAKAVFAAFAQAVRGLTASASTSTSASASASAGVGMEHVFYVHLFLSDMQHFAAANALYKETFHAINPASRCCVELSGLRDGGAAVVLDGLVTRTPRQVLHVQSVSHWAPSCIGPYSQASTLCGVSFLAGQIALDPPTMTVRAKGARDQTRQCLWSNAQVLREIGADPQHILMCAVFVHESLTAADCAVVRSECEAALRVRPKDDANAPAPSAAAAVPVVLIAVPRLPRDALVEVQVIAYQKRFGSAVLWPVPRKRKAPKSATAADAKSAAASPTDPRVVPFASVEPAVATAAAASDTAAYSVIDVGVHSPGLVSCAFVGVAMAPTAAATAAGADAAVRDALTALAAAVQRRCSASGLAPLQAHALSVRVYHRRELRSDALRTVLDPLLFPSAAGAAVAPAPAAVTYAPVSALPAFGGATAQCQVAVQLVLLDTTAVHSALTSLRPPVPCACFTPQQTAALAAAELTDSDDDDDDAAAAAAAAAAARRRGPVPVRAIGRPLPGAPAAAAVKR